MQEESEDEWGRMARRAAARLTGGGGNIERNRLEKKKGEKSGRRLREGGGERAKDGGAKRK